MASGGISLGVSWNARTIRYMEGSFYNAGGTLWPGAPAVETFTSWETGVWGVEVTGGIAVQLPEGHFHRTSTTVEPIANWNENDFSKLFENYQREAFWGIKNYWESFWYFLTEGFIYEASGGKYTGTDLLPNQD